MLKAQCPKHVFFSKTKLKGYTTDAIIEWNTGATGKNIKKKTGDNRRINVYIGYPKTK